MNVLLGMASKDEVNHYHSGKAGDQTGKEVYIRPWYSRPWDVDIRWKDKALAQKFAEFLSILCKCSKIGYDQWQRTTLWDECEKIGWDINRIDEINPCECDCSSLMAVAARFCGIIVNRNITTRNLEDAFRATGKVVSLRDSKYTARPDYLEIGDILLNTRYHVGAVVSTDKPVARKEEKKMQYAGVVTLSNPDSSDNYLNVRSGTGTAFSVVKLGGEPFRLPHGMVVSIERESNGWGKLTNVNGWVSLQYIKR